MELNGNFTLGLKMHFKPHKIKKKIWVQALIHRIKKNDIFAEKNMVVKTFYKRYIRCLSGGTVSMKV